MLKKIKDILFCVKEKLIVSENSSTSEEAIRSIKSIKKRSKKEINKEWPRIIGMDH